MSGGTQTLAPGAAAAMQRAFVQVDVFGAAPLGGNPLAVVLDASGLDDARMQAFARWTNLSETAFLLAPDDPAADYRVRIFTPGGELPFAGHPTLGSAWAWLHAGGRPRRDGVLVQQCGIGRVEVAIDSDGLAFAAPPMASQAVEPALLARICAALGLDAARVQAARWLDNGPRWLALRVDSAQTVLALEPDHAALESLAKVGVIGAQPPGHDTAFEVRAFAAPLGIAEDPVTGSLNASLAQWLIADGRAVPPYVVAQGTRLGRAGRVRVRADAARLWVGGTVTLVIEGQAAL